MSDNSEPRDPGTANIEVRYEFTPVLRDILSHLRCSLMVTTYQAGKLLVLGVHQGELKVSFNSYDQPMGLAAADGRLAVGTRRQINFLQSNREVASSVSPAGTWDVCYVPRVSSWTGNIHGHDLAWGKEGLWVVNTLFSCLSTLHEDFSFVPRWKPPFITELIDQDRCHLNGVAMVAGNPAFVSAMSETNTAAGWRPTKATSGVILDVASGEVVSRGLAMPHSPRWYQGRLWVLDSGRGTLGTVDPATGRVEVVETFPGYTRGLSFCGQFAFVGLSRIRETSVFGGVPIAEKRESLKCGVGVVDLVSGKTVAVFQFLSGVTEIFAVEAIPGTSCPYVAGASTDGHEHDVWIVPRPGFVPATSHRLPWFAGVGSQSNEPEEVPLRPVAVNDASRLASRSTLEVWLEQHPEDAAAWISLGNLRQEQDRQSEAVLCYEKAVHANPAMSAARQNLGYLLFNQGFAERARQVYHELLALDPSPMNRLLAASVLPVVYQSCEDIQRWRSAQQAALQQMVNEEVTVDAGRQLVPTTFFWAYQGCNDADIMRLRGRIIRGDIQFHSESPERSVRDGRLRVGFLSAYFRNHTIGRLNVGRIEHLDRARFEVTVCSASGGSDAFTERFRKAADHFVRVPRDVAAAVSQIRSLNLDVLVFADVGMDALCSTLAFSRMAPVQCVTWGHPETTGSPVMDYFLSGDVLDLEDAPVHYTEKLIRLPGLGTWYERPRAPEEDPGFLRRAGLPEGRRLYVCPQTLFKIHPDDDVVFRRILEADSYGILVMIEGRVEEWTTRLKARWQKTLAGFSDRIHFLKAQPHEDFLRLLQAATVVLDPLHFGGGNSTYEAIAMEAPVISMPGQYLRSRITAALFERMGMSDLLAQNQDQYVQLAVQTARDANRREEFRTRLRRSSSRIFEAIEEVRCFEQALSQCAAASLPR